MPIMSYLPPPDVIAKLEPEVLAGHILEFLNSMEREGKTDFHNLGYLIGEYESNATFSLDNIMGPSPTRQETLTADAKLEISRAINEAWKWLEPYPVS